MSEQIKYECENNPELRIALGVSIATGRMRKEIAREIFIFLSIYEERLIQRLHNPLADWIIQDSRNYTGKVILQNLAGWWIWEGMDRCTIISQFFTQLEQEQILAKLVRIQKMVEKSQKSML